MVVAPSRVGNGLKYAALFLSLGTLLVMRDTFIDHDSSRFLRGASLVTTERRSMQEVDNSTCNLECCQELESTICASGEDAWAKEIPFAIQVLLIIALICTSALFSGLTLGLLSLDTTGLEIIMEGDDPKRAERAKRVLTVRRNGNLLLCTLIFGNVVVNSFLSILMGQYFGGIIGLVASTVSIVVFGEILPQAACARYALEIGSVSVPMVRVVIFLFYPFSYPLAFCLNKILGNELPTTYSNAEMHKLIQIHVDHGRFDAETADAMAGALKYKTLTVKEVMTSIENTFMLNVDEKLSFQTIATIFKTGYSRIPVYEISRNSIIGLLFVKDLIFVDPEDETSVRSFVQIFGRSVHVVWPDDTLGDILRELKKGKSHMALVRDVNKEDKDRDPFYEIKGIITLEDIIEEIIGDEIVDETDAFVDGTHSVKVDRREVLDWGRLSLLDSKIVAKTLPHEEVKAITAHLRTNYTDSFVLLTDNQLHKLVSKTSVDELPEAKHEVGQQVPEDLLYCRGVESDIFTLILSGKVTVISGDDQFRSDVSSWSVLGSRVFQEASYLPDFTAFVAGGPCRCLRIPKASFNEAVDASAVERRTFGHEHVAISMSEDEPEAKFKIKEIDNAANTLKRESRRAQILAALQPQTKDDVGDNETDSKGGQTRSLVVGFVPTDQVDTVGNGEGVVDTAPQSNPKLDDEDVNKNDDLIGKA